MTNAKTQIAAGPSLSAIRFVPTLPPEGELIACFQQPEALLASGSPLSALPQDGQALSEAGFVLLAVSPADQAGQQQAQAWMQSGEFSEPAIRLNVDGGWVLYRPGRAVICAPEAVTRDLRVALADVQFHDGQLRQLEAQVARDWDTAQSLIPLAHHADTKRAKELKALALDTLTRRMICARIERPLLVPLTPMTETARKLAEKLRDQLEIEDRLETVDGQIEVYEDLCEAANQRLSDYTHFIREFIVEMVIVFLLGIEVLIALMYYFVD
jgi:hypothetical protein